MSEQYTIPSDIRAHQRSLWRKLRRGHGDGCADAFVAGMRDWEAEAARAGARYRASVAPLARFDGEDGAIQAAARSVRVEAFRADVLHVLHTLGSVAAVRRRLAVTEEMLRAYVTGAAVPSAEQAAEVRAMVERLGA